MQPIPELPTQHGGTAGLPTQHGGTAGSASSHSAEPRDRRVIQPPRTSAWTSVDLRATAPEFYPRACPAAPTSPADRHPRSAPPNRRAPTDVQPPRRSASLLCSPAPRFSPVTATIPARGPGHHCNRCWSAWGVHDEVPRGGICSNCPGAVELEDGGPIYIAPAPVAALAYVVAGPPGIRSSSSKCPAESQGSPPLPNRRDPRPDKQKKTCRAP